MCLKWFKRRGKKEKKVIEKKGIVGKIIETEYAYKGIISTPVTLFSLEIGDGHIERIAMDGHQLAPKEGDRVEVFLGDRIANRDESPQYEKQNDGSVKKVELGRTYWLEIIQYKILEDYPEKAPERSDRDG